MKDPGSMADHRIARHLPSLVVLAVATTFGTACRSTSAGAMATPNRGTPEPTVTVTGSNLRVPASEAEGTLPSTAQTVRRIPASEIESKGRGSLVDVLRLVPQIR